MSHQSPSSCCCYVVGATSCTKLTSRPDAVLLGRAVPFHATDPTASFALYSSCKMVIVEATESASRPFRPVDSQNRRGLCTWAASRLSCRPSRPLMSIAKHLRLNYLAEFPFPFAFVFEASKELLNSCLLSQSPRRLPTSAHLPCKTICT